MALSETRQLNLILKLKDQASRQLQGFSGAISRANTRVDGVRGATSNLKTDLTGIGERFSTEFGLMASSAKLAAGAIAGISAAAIYMGKKTVEAAGRAEDVDTLFGLAFKNTEDEMRDFTDSFSKEFGRATTDIKKQASDMGFALSMGTELGEDAMADMTKQSVEAAEGLAIAYDRVQDGEQAMSAITKAYNGSNDALQELIPTIREERIKQEAVNMGLADTKEQVDRTARAQALHKMIMEGSVKSREMLSEAEGTYTDTMMRTEAAIQNTSETIGSIFKPMVTDAFKSILPWINQFSGWVEEKTPMIREEIRKMAQKAKEKIEEWYDSVGGKEGIENALKNLWKTIKEDVIPAIKSFFGKVAWIIGKIIEYKDEIWVLIEAYYAFKIAMAGKDIIAAFATFAGKLVTAGKGLMVLKGKLASTTWGVRLLKGALLALPATISIAIVIAATKALKTLEEIGNKIDDVVDNGAGLERRSRTLRNRLKEDISQQEREAIRQDLIEVAKKQFENPERLRGSREAGFTDLFTGVDDAVITPKGDVIKTNPKDFIMATQNPGELAGGGGNNITINLPRGMMIDRNNASMVADVLSEEIRRRLRL